MALSSAVILKCSQHFWSAWIIDVQEIFRHYWCAGKFPALVKCRKFSSICEVQEIFLHWWSALLSWNFPALVKCRKFSAIFSWNFPALVVFVQKIFLHFLYSGNFPAFLFVHKTYQACNKSCAVSISHTFHSFQCIFVGHLFPHYLTSSINMCKSAGQMFLHV